MCEALHVQRKQRQLFLIAQQKEHNRVVNEIED